MSEIQAKSLYNPQYLDSNISQKHFDKYEKDQLLVKSIFLTLQGEGPFTGRQAVFVRLAGCNRGSKLKMQCGFCDTDFRVKTGNVLSFKEIGQQIQDKLRTVYSYHRTPHPLVVITGGEPMLQDNLVPFIEFLLDNSYQVQIESNGDRIAKGFEDVKSRVTLIVCPKVKPSSGYYIPLKKNVVNCMSYLKILIDARKNSPYHKLPIYLADLLSFSLGSNEIYISPIAVYRRPVNEDEIASFWDSSLIDCEKTRDNYRFAALICQQYNYVLSLQTHLLFELS